MEITPEAVVERVRSAGGTLVVEDDERVLTAWRHAAKVAQLRLLRAGTERLRSRSTPGTLTLRLVEVDAHGDERRPQGTRRTAAPPPRPEPRTSELRGRLVPVPSSVRKPDPLVDQLVRGLENPERMTYRSTPYLMPNPRRPLQRMRRIWQAIITEASFRGYQSSFRHHPRDHFDRGQLVLHINRDEFPIELYGERGHPLRLTITERHPSRRRGYDTWTDTPDQPLHMRLGEIFTHIEQWADLLREQRDEERRREQQRARDRQRREEQARHQFAEDHRRATIAARVDTTRFVDHARAYAAALASAAGHLNADRAADVRAWADWIREHSDQIDPRHSAAGMPATPEATHEELRPYLPPGHWY